MCFVEVVVVGVAAVEVPTLRAHVPADKGVLSLVAASPEFLFHV
jgi:hypothetical protein